MTQAMARQGARVTATVIDRDTLSVDGEVYRRDHGDECLLRHNGKHTGRRIQPEDLECSNCGWSHEYFFWYEGTCYYNRLVNYCPGCGLKILGVVANDGD